MASRRLPILTAIAGYEKDGQALLKIWHELPDDPLNDKELVDTWADYLGLQNVVHLGRLRAACLRHVRLDHDDN